jgi:hypothetical protein
MRLWLFFSRAERSCNPYRQFGRPAPLVYPFCPLPKRPASKDDRDEYATFGSAFSFGTEASAKECKWFGTAPFCNGRCPSGWSLENFSGKGCIGTWGISGTKALCCRVEKPCGPKQYGTPGCPYPRFGGGKWKPSPGGYPGLH